MYRACELSASDWVRNKERETHTHFFHTLSTAAPSNKKGYFSSLSPPLHKINTVALQVIGCINDEANLPSYVYNAYTWHRLRSLSVVFGLWENWKWLGEVFCVTLRILGMRQKQARTWHQPVCICKYLSQAFVSSLWSPSSLSSAAVPTVSGLTLLLSYNTLTVFPSVCIVCRLSFCVFSTFGGSSLLYSSLLHDNSDLKQCQD